MRIYADPDPQPYVKLIVLGDRPNLGVVLLGCNVEGGQAHLTPGVILQEDRHHLGTEGINYF